MDKETKLRSILFFVIGFLLVLSLIICIYIVAGERKLVATEATVVDVVKDSGGLGVNSIQIDYSVNGTSYFSSFETKKSYNINDKINIYYYSNNVEQVKFSKTSKLIFLCPVIGLLLCSLGVFELYRKRNDGEDEFKTSIIGVVGDTEQLKIVTETSDVQTPATEPEVKAINTPVEEDIPAQLPEASEEVELPAVAVPEEIPEPAPVEPAPVVEATPVAEPIPEPVPEPVLEPVVEEPVSAPTPETPVVQEEIVAPTISDISNVEEVPSETVQQPTKSSDSGLEATLIEKIKEKNGDKIEVSEDELKEAIKGVLADVIKEVKQEKTKKEVVQVRVIPNYYYISGTSLMYEEAGKEQKELDLKEVKSVTRTINEAGVVVKLVVESPEVKCILTNMKNIDLEQLANLLRNKMRAMDENFEEVIEHKEY